MTSVEEKENPEAPRITLEEALKLAHTHHKRGNLLVAERTYKDVLAAVPDNFDALHHLGVILYQRGNLKAGLEYLEKAVAQFDEDYRSLNNYAIMLCESGEREKAIATWEKAIELNSGYPDAYSNLANALWLEGLYKEAEESCRKAIEVNSDYLDAYLNLGNALQKQDRMDEAIETWLSIEEKDPTYSKALSNLSNAYYELKDIDKAEEYAHKAIACNDPGNAEAYNNLGVVLRHRNELEKAQDAFRKAVEIRPSYIDAHDNLTLVLIDQAKYAEAVVAARLSIALSSEASTARRNLSEALRQLGQFEEAEAEAQAAVSINPENVHNQINLAEIYFVMERFDEAEEILNKAIEQSPDTANAYIRLADVLEKRDRVDEAIAVVEKLIEDYPDVPKARLKLAATCYMAGQVDRAIEICTAALEKEPGFVLMENLLADLKIVHGDLEGAREISRKIVDAGHHAPSIYFTLSTSKKFEDENDEDLKQMESLLDKSFSQEQKATLNFALAKAYDDLKQYDKAMEYYQSACTLKRKTLFYEPLKQKFGYERLRGMYSAEYLKSVEGKGCPSEVPVFIVGMPRSGTTLTEQIISSHPEVFGAGELPHMNNIEKRNRIAGPDKIAAAGQEYVDLATSLAPDAKRITDKLPGNFSILGFIVSALPNARIIHCRRNPADTALSCYKQMFANGQHWSYDFAELGGEYNNYLKMMEHWREVLPEGRFLEIDYEETVGNFEESARKLIDHVGLEWDEACLEPHKQKRVVRTASSTQVIQPVYQSSVKKWKRHEEAMQPFVEVVGAELCE